MPKIEVTNVDKKPLRDELEDLNNYKFDTIDELAASLNKFNKDKDTMSNFELNMLWERQANRDSHMAMVSHNFMGCLLSSYLQSYISEEIEARKDA